MEGCKTIVAVQGVDGEHCVQEVNLKAEGKKWWSVGISLEDVEDAQETMAGTKGTSAASPGLRATQVSPGAGRRLAGKVLPGALL